MPTRIRFPPITLALFGLALIPGLVALDVIWTLVGPDGISLVTHKLPVWDYANLWSGGTLARHGDLATLFDTESYRAWLRNHFSPRYEDSEWSYPPTMLLLGVPFSLLGVLPSYLLWVVTTAAALFVVLRQGGLHRSVAVVSMLSPAMVQSVIYGQNGALTAAFLCGGLLLVPRRQGAAGISAGLLLVKPQFAVLFPFIYLASRSWRAIAFAVTTVVVSAGTVYAAFGQSAWVLFWTRTRPLMTSVLEASWPAGHLVNGVTVFFAARAMGLGIKAAFLLQGISALGAGIVAVWAWRMPAADPALRMALTIPLALLATPYAYNYDLVALGVATVLLLSRNGWHFTAITATAWFWPGLAHHFGARGWLLSPCIFAVFAAAAWKAMKNERSCPAVTSSDKPAHARG